jgi:hypothetical protein
VAVPRLVTDQIEVISGVDQYVPKDADVIAGQAMRRHLR